MTQATLVSAVQPRTQPAVYDIDDLTVLLDISKRKAWDLASSNTIPGRLALGRSARWAKSVVDAWIANGCKAK
jgi:predicted DNA-binding transcriptional regulator AlpA